MTLSQGKVFTRLRPLQKVIQGCICSQILQIFFGCLLLGAKQRFLNSGERPPAPPEPEPQFSEAQTSLFLSEASAWPPAQRLCDLHDSEVSSELATSGSDKHHHHQVSRKRHNKPRR